MYKYSIISPVRDEEQYLEHTIKSVARQTVKPTTWVIVNDGSTDGTGRIIDSYAKQYRWIRASHRKDRGFRKAGGGVIDAFYAGYESVENEQWDFIVKLDGDLSFESTYFEECLQRFDRDSKLGIGGGAIWDLVDGVTKFEPHQLFHVRGATKIYKRECWCAIGGLIRAPGWDTLDEIKANMLGWKTQTFKELKVVHYRPTGAADGAWRNWVKNGLANYISGYHPLFMFTKCLKRLTARPYLMVSIGLMVGFLSGYIRKTPQVADRPLINYLRKQQLRRLFLKSSVWQ